MSAYMVGRENIWAIVDAWACAKYGGIGYQACASWGQTLWDENKHSVKYRYPDCEGDDLPGPIGCDFVYGKHEISIGKRKYSPVQILKACHCLEYQSCEHPEWEDSQARAFLADVRESMERKVPGYEEASWGID